MSAKLNPVEYLLKKLDIEKKELARVLEIQPETISRWRSTEVIPLKYFKRIIKLARERAAKMSITEQELREGGVLEDEE